MENRRDHYRHVFAPRDRLAAEVTVPGVVTPLAAEVHDLSVAGMSLMLRQASATLPNDGVVMVVLRLPGGEGRLTFACQVVHIHAVEAERFLCGLAFVPLGDPTAERERGRRLWQFLLEEQHRVRRQRIDGFFQPRRTSR